jgi:predicted O-methyltransferase YrrM
MEASKLTEIAVFRGACQKLRELRPVVALLQRRRLHTVIEIGTMKGGTLWLWCQLARPDAMIISIDLPGGEFGGGYHLKDLARFRSYAQEDQLLHFLRSDSHTQATREAVARKLNGRKVDLLFIDGDHRYSGVKKDFTMYAPLVKPGGVVLLHDILPHPRVPACEVERFWQEIKGHFQYKEFVEPDDERGWGQWGGLGLLFYTAEAYHRAVQRTAQHAVAHAQGQTSKRKRRVQQSPSLG